MDRNDRSRSPEYADLPLGVAPGESISAQELGMAIDKLSPMALVDCGRLDARLYLPHWRYSWPHPMSWSNVRPKIYPE